MTAGNFNWFLHTMLFLHTVRVIRKQKLREEQEQDEEEDESESEED
jgi:hypothetical protein